MQEVVANLQVSPVVFSPGPVTQVHYRAGLARSPSGLQGYPPDPTPTSPSPAASAWEGGVRGQGDVSEACGCPAILPISPLSFSSEGTLRGKSGNLAVPQE